MDPARGSGDRRLQGSEHRDGLPGLYAEVEAEQWPEQTVLRQADLAHAMERLHQEFFT